MSYDATAGLALFAASSLLIALRQAVTRRVPALARVRAENRAEDAAKLAREKYPPMVRASARVGRYATLGFFALVAPLVVTLAPQPPGRVLLDAVLVLMAYDLAYYATHRFVFHGPLMREVHAVHHQARSPTWIDAQYVHPLETFVGIALFVGAVVAVAGAQGRLHVAGVTASFLLFTQLNLLNHTRVRLSGFPWGVLGWISAKHAIHHESMRRGNYATITLLYDRLFGTFE